MRIYYCANTHTTFNDGEKNMKLLLGLAGICLGLLSSVSNAAVTQPYSHIANNANNPNANQITPANPDDSANDQDSVPNDQDADQSDDTASSDDGDEDTSDQQQQDSSNDNDYE